MKYNINISNSIMEEDIQYFTNNKHHYKAKINPDQYGGFFVKIGGKEYGDCINIDISKGDKHFIGKITHIQSERECTYDSILEDGDTVPFVKASLQFCCELFKNLNYFEFDDMSNIECGITKSGIPPRKLAKSLSLSYFSIALYGKTLYERQFGAKMENTINYNNYRNEVENLYKPIDLPYDSFKQQNKLSTEHDIILSKYYNYSIEKSDTWIEFFNKIPKEERCAGFFNWLPFFIEKKIKKTFNPFGWYIDMNTMPNKTKLKIINIKKGGQWNKTIKQKKNIIRFKNSIEANSLIFDGGSKYY